MRARFLEEPGKRVALAATPADADVSTPIPAAAYAIVAAVSIIHLCCAGAPLTTDETYYWAWSKHLQLGYVDHPPMIGYAIAAGGFLGNSPFAVRFPIVILQAVTALALGRAAIALGGGRTAALMACAACALLPTERCVSSHAFPEIPYLAGWSIALACAASARRSYSVAGALVLGAALATTVLSRVFGWALVAALVATSLPADERSLRRALMTASVVFAAAVTPWLWWNAQHHWVTLFFSAVGRHRFGPGWANLAGLSALRALTLAVPATIVGWLTTVRRPRPLLAWSSLPLIVGFTLISPIYPIESYFLLGPLMSLIVAAALALENRGAGRLRTIVVSGWAALWLATLPGTIVPALSPQAQGALQRVAGSRAVSVYASDAPLFAHLAAAIEASPAMQPVPQPLLAEAYTIAAPLYHAGLRAGVIGSRPLNCEWNGFRDINAALPPVTAGAWLIVTSAHANGSGLAPGPDNSERRFPARTLTVSDDIGRTRSFRLYHLSGRALDRIVCRSFAAEYLPPPRP